MSAAPLQGVRVLDLSRHEHSAQLAKSFLLHKIMGNKIHIA
jgi:hypothetical protein